MSKEKNNRSHFFLKTFMPLLARGPDHIRAAKAIPLLLQLAIKQKTITYGELAAKLNLGNPRHVVRVLSLASHIIENFYGPQAPDICALVVSSVTGIPGDGYARDCPDKDFPVNKDSYPLLPLAAKRQIMADQQAKVFAFARWPELLGLANDFNKYYT